MGEAVGLVDEVGELAFEREGFGGLGAGRVNRAGVLVAEALEGGDGEGVPLAADALYLGDESVGVEIEACKAAL